MRRRTIHRLANLGRIAAVLASLGAALLLAAFAWPGSAVGSVEAWLGWRPPIVEDWEARLRAADGAELRALALELDAVRKLDRLAPVARQAHWRGLQAARQQGDLASAIAAARWLLHLDDRDLEAIGALGELLGRDPGTHKEAIDLLQQARARAPASGVLLAPLTSLLVRTGDVAAAGAVLQAMADEPTSHQWTVRWGPEAGASVLPVRGPDGRLQLCFTVDDDCRELTLQAPMATALSLQEAALEVTDRDGVIAQPLAAWQPRLRGMRWQGDALLAPGEDEQALIVRPRTAGPLQVTMTWREGPAQAEWLRQLLRGEVGRALAQATAVPTTVLRLRAEALLGTVLRLTATTASGPVERLATLEGEVQNGGLAVQLEFAVPAGCQRLVLVLPPELQTLQQPSLVCRGEGGSELATLDAGEPEAATAVAVDATGWRVTGAAPQLSWSLPPAAAGCRSVALRGMAR